MFVANLVILAQMCDELLRRQAEFPKIFSQNGQNDLEGKGQWPQFSLPAASIPGHVLGANLVIPPQICDELSCGQDKVYGRTFLENLISAAMKQAAPHTCFFFLVFFI